MVPPLLPLQMCLLGPARPAWSSRLPSDTRPWAGRQIVHPRFMWPGLVWGMLQRLFSIAILAAAITVLALPMPASADHRARPPQIWSTLAWPFEWLERPVPRAHQGRRILIQQGRRDHDRARAAVSAGRILPLQQILRRIRGRYPGRLLDAALARNNQGRSIYRLKLLAPNNRVQQLVVDAQSGRVLQSRGRR